MHAVDTARETVARAVIRDAGRLELETAPLPEPGPGEVRLRPLAIGICGSDLHVLAGHHPFVRYPVLPGHEIAAEVSALGPGVDAGWLGARVALEPSLTCGVCDPCRRGRYNICETLEVMGFQAPGGMAEAFVAPLDRLHRLPEGMSAAAGALVEPLAVAVHALRLASPTARDTAVVGAGTIGLLTALVARAHGAARVLVADRDEARRARAADLGFETAAALPEQAFDLVAECVGVEGALRGAIQACRKGGEVLVVGVYGDDPRVQAGLIQDWELRLIGSLMYVGDDYREAIRLLAEGRVDPDAIVSHRFPLAELNAAFAQAHSGGETLKVLLEP